MKREFSRRLVTSLRLDTLPLGTPVRVRHPPFHVLVIRLPEGDGDTVVAIEDSCNHAGASLAKGHVVDGDCIACPLHGYVFSLRTGKLVRPLRLCDDQRRFEVERDGEWVHIYEPDVLTILGP